MRSFSELLREYTARTGISDTELARALGVRRQTVFRWKEGLVEKPRSRDDILRCAAKLRLGPAERDEFLLSAGFAPESPPLATSGAQAEPVPEINLPQPPRAAPPTPAADEIGAPIGRPPRFGKRAVLQGLSALLLGLLLAGWLVAGAGLPGGREEGVAPATSGETLIVVGAAPEPAGRGVSARLKVALDREAQAGRVGQLRVAVWPEGIPDAGAATAAARRTGAALVVAIAVGTDDRLDGLVLKDTAGGAMVPLVQMKIRPAAVEDVRAVALLLLAAVHAQRGDVGLARAVLLPARESPLADPASEASLAVYFDQLGQQ